jgi:hypothetical protein
LWAHLLHPARVSIGTDTICGPWVFARSARSPERGDAPGERPSFVDVVVLLVLRSARAQALQLPAHPRGWLAVGCGAGLATHAGGAAATRDVRLRQAAEAAGAQAARPAKAHRAATAARAARRRGSGTRSGGAAGGTSSSSASSGWPKQQVCACGSRAHCARAATGGFVCTLWGCSPSPWPWRCRRDHAPTNAHVCARPHSQHNSEGGVTIEWQRQRAKEMRKYFADAQLEQQAKKSQCVLAAACVVCGACGPCCVERRGTCGRSLR